MKSYVTAFFSRPINFDSFCGASKSTFFLPGQPLITEPLITNNDPLLIKAPTELPLAFLPPSHPLSPLADRAHPPQSWACLRRAEPRWAVPPPPGESPRTAVSRPILTCFLGFLPPPVLAEKLTPHRLWTFLSLPGRSRITPHQASPTHDAREEPGCRPASGVLSEAHKLPHRMKKRA